MHKYSLFLNIWFGHRLCSLATKRITRIKFSSYNLVHSVGNSMAGVELDGGEDGLTGWSSGGSSHSNWGSSISSWGNSGNSWGSSIGSWGNSSDSWGSSISGSGNSWGSSIDSWGNSWGSSIGGGGNSWGSNDWGSGISCRGNSSQSRGSSIVVRSICREGWGSSIGVVESVSISRPLDLSSSIVGLKEAGLGSSNLRGVRYGKRGNSIVDRGSRGKSTVDRGNREVVTGNTESEVISNVVDSVDSSLISIG